MATITTFKDGAYGPRNVGAPFLSYARLDFAKTPVAAADVVQIVTIPAGTVVENVFVTVITPEGATCTADLGDGTDPNGFDDAISFNATAGTITYGITGTDILTDNLGATQGKIYTTADTLDFTMDHAADVAVIDVVIKGYNITR